MKKSLVVLWLLACSHQAFSQTAKADSFIAAFTKANNFNGTILIEQGSKTVYRKSFGMADFSFEIPNTPDTKYKIASITKAFTSVMILQLVEQGKIDLDKPFKTYLPDYKGPAGDLVTVRQLLNMTSGMRNMDDNAPSLEAVLKNGLPQYQHPYSASQMISNFCSDTLVKRPGTAFDYNNADFIILGKIIEQVSGKTYEQQLKETILAPLHMLNSGVLSADKITSHLAATYFYRDDLKALVPDLPVYAENWYGAGAMYSTADDLQKFFDALFGGKLLKKAMLDQLFNSGLGEYGLGVWVYLKYDIHHKMYTIVKRPGSIMGAQTMLFHILEDGSTIIILSNTGTVSLDNLAADIATKIIK